MVKGEDKKASTKDPDPNSGTKYSLGDNYPRDVDQREIVDNSMLGLVLFGVKPWNDQTVLNSLQVADETTGADRLAVDTPSGRIWRRFTFDGYGEQAERRAVGHLPRGADARPSGGRGHCSPASAASTS